MDNIITYSAQNYAEALFEAGKTFTPDLELINTVITTSADFMHIMSNPAIDLNVKYSILDEIFKDKINEKVLQFVKILTEKNRLGEFEQILAAYKEKVNDENGVKLVEITSAIELNEDFKTKILNKLSEKLNKKIVPEWKIDREIISGLVFKIGDDVVDTSIRNKVESIGKNTEQNRKLRTENRSRKHRFRY